MTEKKGFPDEIFDWRVKRYRERKRTKLPCHEAAETSGRVNRLVHSDKLDIASPYDFSFAGENGAPDNRLPINLFDVKFSYNSIDESVTISGAGGSVVLENDVCMIDFTRRFLEYIQAESCGECTFCRVGSRRMYEILSRICTGGGRMDDIETLEILAEKIGSATLCEVGKTSARPVLCTVKYFQSDYDDHITNHRCRAGACRFD